MRIDAIGAISLATGKYSGYVLKPSFCSYTPLRTNGFGRDLALSLSNYEKEPCYRRQNAYTLKSCFYNSVIPFPRFVKRNTGCLGLGSIEDLRRLIAVSITGRQSCAAS